MPDHLLVKMEEKPTNPFIGKMDENPLAHIIHLYIKLYSITPLPSLAPLYPPLPYQT